MSHALPRLRQEIQYGSGHGKPGTPSTNAPRSPRGRTCSTRSSATSGGRTKNGSPTWTFGSVCFAMDGATPKASLPNGAEPQAPEQVPGVHPALGSPPSMESSEELVFRTALRMTLLDHAARSSSWESSAARRDHTASGQSQGNESPPPPSEPPGREPESWAPHPGHTEALRRPTPPARGGRPRRSRTVRIETGRGVEMDDLPIEAGSRSLTMHLLDEENKCQQVRSPVRVTLAGGINGALRESPKKRKRDEQSMSIELAGGMQYVCHLHKRAGAQGIPGRGVRSVGHMPTTTKRN